MQCMSGKVNVLEMAEYEKVALLALFVFKRHYAACLGEVEPQLS